MSRAELRRNLDLKLNLATSINGRNLLQRNRISGTQIRNIRLYNSSRCTGGRRKNLRIHHRSLGSRSNTRHRRRCIGNNG